MKDSERNLSIAILIDGGFFIKRYRQLYSKSQTPEYVANQLFTFALKHVGDNNYLYRILYYDAEPLSKSVLNPISKQQFNFGNTEEAVFRFKFFDELRKKRKVALRLGY
jgi:hypothetical protein